MIETEGLIFWHVKDSGWLLLILTSSDKTAQIGWVPADCERQFWAQWFGLNTEWWVKDFFPAEHNLLCLFMWTSSGKTAQIGWVPADCERQFWAQWFSVSRGWWIKGFFSPEHISNLLCLFMWTGSGNSAQTGRICTDCEDSSGHEDSIRAEIGKPKDWFSLAYVIVLLFDISLFLHCLLSHLPHPPPPTKPHLP